MTDIPYNKENIVEDRLVCSTVGLSYHELSDDFLSDSAIEEVDVLAVNMYGD